MEKMNKMIEKLNNNLINAQNKIYIVLDKQEEEMEELERKYLEKKEALKAKHDAKFAKMEADYEKLETETVANIRSKMEHFGLNCIIGNTNNDALIAQKEQELKEYEEQLNNQYITREEELKGHIEELNTILYELEHPIVEQIIEPVIEQIIEQEIELNDWPVDVDDVLTDEEKRQNEEIKNLIRKSPVMIPIEKAVPLEDMLNEDEKKQNEMIKKSIKRTTKETQKETEMSKEELEYFEDEEDDIDDDVKFNNTNIEEFTEFMFVKKIQIDYIKKGNNLLARLTYSIIKASDVAPEEEIRFIKINKCQTIYKELIGRTKHNEQLFNDTLNCSSRDTNTFKLLNDKGDILREIRIVYDGEKGLFECKHKNKNDAYYSEKHEKYIKIESPKFKTKCISLTKKNSRTVKEDNKKGLEFI